MLIRLDRVSEWFLFSEFIRYNLNDFLCIPIVLTLTLCMLRYLKQDYNIQLSIGLVFGEAIFYSIFFELVLPFVSLKYTADPIDILMYFLGACFYWMIMRE